MNLDDELLNRLSKDIIEKIAERNGLYEVKDKKKKARQYANRAEKLRNMKEYMAKNGGTLEEAGLKLGYPKDEVARIIHYANNNDSDKGPTGSGTETQTESGTENQTGSGTKQNDETNDEDKLLEEINITFFDSYHSIGGYIYDKAKDITNYGISDQSKKDILWDIYAELYEGDSGDKEKVTGDKEKVTDDQSEVASDQSEVTNNPSTPDDQSEVANNPSTPDDQSEVTNNPGTPDDQGEVTGGQGRTTNNQGRTTYGPGRTTNNPGRTTDGQGEDAANENDNQYVNLNAYFSDELSNFYNTVVSQTNPNRSTIESYLKTLKELTKYLKQSLRRF